MPSSERKRTRSTSSARVRESVRPAGISEPAGFCSSIDGERDRDLAVLGVAEDQFGIGLADLQAGEDPAVVVATTMA